VLTRRPDDVVRIAYARSARKPLAEALRMAARRRIAYQELDPEALAGLAEAEHHEGVCVLARPRPAPTLDAVARAQGPGGVLVALDGVNNTHNVVSILHSAALPKAAPRSSRSCTCPCSRPRSAPRVQRA
jgi:TrmH RNA methyltransferase